MTDTTAVTETSAYEIASPGKYRDPGNQVSEPNCPQSGPSGHYEGDVWQPQVFEEGLEEAFAPSENASASNPVARAQQVMELQASREAQNNGENVSKLANQPSGRVKKYFIDPQPNAERIVFDSQEQVKPASENQDQYPLRRENSAVEDVPADETEELGTEEGFQQDERHITKQTRRDRISPEKRSAPAPSVMRHLPNEDSVASSDSGDSDEAGYHQEQTPAPSQLENYKNANKVAKFKSSSQMKRPQIRKAWTNEETKALIRLIEKYGTSWAFLKEKDMLKKKKLEYRDQGALKDKARNMKFDFLKSVLHYCSNSKIGLIFLRAGTLMPHNFDNIALNKLQIYKLQNMGIPYPATIKEDDD